MILSIAITIRNVLFVFSLIAWKFNTIDFISYKNQQKTAQHNESWPKCFFVEQSLLTLKSSAPQLGCTLVCIKICLDCINKKVAFYKGE